MDKKVSIIISEYNTDPKLLEKSINSILQQTYKNIEIVAIDDSGNNKLEYLKEKYKDNRLKIYKNKKNEGLVYSLNRALKYADGYYIARADTDDICIKNRIEEQVKYLEKHKEIDMVASRCDYYDENGKWGESKWHGKVTKEVMKKGNPIIHPTIMIKKNVLISNGGYLDYKRCEDTATWINLLLNGTKIYVMNDKLIEYHLGKDDYEKRKLKNRKDSFRNLKEQYIKLNPTRIEYAKKYIKLLLSSLLPTMIIYKFQRNKFKYK